MSNLEPLAGALHRAGFRISPLLKLSKRVTVVGPAAGKTVAKSGPYSLVELPPKLLVVPGMKLPPSCQVQVPLAFVVE